MAAVKDLVARLRHQYRLLDRLQYARLSADWLAATREVVNRVFIDYPDLEQIHGPLWRQDPMASGSIDGKSASEATDPDWQAYRDSLNKMIRSLNRTDEVSYTNSPVLVLTFLGILFLLFLAGGSYLYYVFVVR